MEAAKGLKRWHIPAFGNWEYCNEMPITEYFESERQAGFGRASYFGNAGEEVLLKVPVAMPVKSGYHDIHCRRKMRKGNRRRAEEKEKKHGWDSKDVVAQPRRPRSIAPKAVDEDLYKIPPEFLRQKSKNKAWLTKFLSGCLGLNCFVA